MMCGNVFIVFTVILICITTMCAGKKYNPCCSFPCQNRGVCLATKNYEDYTCDCEGTGLSYYGKNCEIPTIGQWISNFIKPRYDMQTYILTSLKPFWSLIEYLTPIKRRIMSAFILARSSFVDSPAIYATNDYEYTILGSALNRTFFARALPPVPKDCPKPLGTYGKDKLPDVDEVVDKLFKRKEFIPDKLGTSLMLPFMAQHFTHQVFKTDFKRGPGHAYGAQAVDASHIYGNNEQVEHALRSHVDGKMKMQTLNGEEYPPYLKDVDMNITLSPEFKIPPGVELFALGHDFFTLIPGLFLFNTIFLREHNRVCDILKKEHPEWDDERLYQTTKLVILGIVMKVIIEDYLQGVSNFHLKIEFDPTLIHESTFKFISRVFVEHNHIYHWHQMMPDEFNIDGTVYPMRDFLFRSDIVVKHGTKNFTESLSKQVSGLITLQNHGPYLMNIVKLAIQHGRELRLMPYNFYREKFGPYKLNSIDQMTENEEHRRLLKELYGDDINGIEFYVGMMAEKRRHEGIFGPGMYQLIAPFSLQGFFSSPVCTPRFWRPSTFGGDVGFNIIKTTNVRNLFCRNMPGECGLVSFRVPGENAENNIPEPKQGKSEL